MKSEDNFCSYCGKKRFQLNKLSNQEVDTRETANKEQNPIRILTHNPLNLTSGLDVIILRSNDKKINNNKK